jgi:crossover junction endodeoxyribonuclease RusA
MIQISFEAPGPLLNMNDRQHHQARARSVKPWKEAAYYAACAWRPGPRARRLDGLQLVTCLLPVRGRKVRDPHNYAPTMKAIIDGLTAAELWPDDSAEFVRTSEPILVVDGALVTVQLVTL